MKKFKKQLGLYASMILLISFTATVLPLDFFHNHSASQTCTTKDGASCTHKIHLSVKKSICWICGLHIDKQFLKEPTIGAQSLADASPEYVLTSLTSIEQWKAFTTLRGPPAV